jgi:hypothetical protein
MNKSEVNLRAPIYDVNLDKEREELKRFINYLKFYPGFFETYYYEVNPANSSKNLMGSDITLYGPRDAVEVDLKGFDSKYKTVALTVQRSDDDVVWRDALSEKKITDSFVFIDELGNMYGMSMIAARKLAKDALDKKPNAYKITEVPAETAGHYQKALIIPLKDLEPLASLVPPYTGRIILY